MPFLPPIAQNRRSVIAGQENVYIRDATSRSCLTTGDTVTNLAESRQREAACVSTNQAVYRIYFDHSSRHGGGGGLRQRSRPYRHVRTAANIPARGYLRTRTHGRAGSDSHACGHLRTSAHLRA